MNSLIRVPLEPDAAQRDQLVQLQATFAAACNALAPTVAERRCWNRVTLHHLSYRELRARFPQLGSQMACNAIYAMSRAARLVYQHPRSPFNLQRLGDRPLPRITFTPESPVYFDRHTLSLRSAEVSLFGLEGRIRCPARLSSATAARLTGVKLREVLLARRAGSFVLLFTTDDGADAGAPPPPGRPAARPVWPDHLRVQASPVDGDFIRPDPAPVHPAMSRTAPETHQTQVER